MRHALFVAFELVGLAIDREAPAADAVGIAAGRRAEIGRMIEVVLEILEAEHQRCRMAFEAQILDDRSPRKDIGGQPAAADGDAVNGFTGGEMAKYFRFCLHGHFPPLAWRQTASFRAGRQPKSHTIHDGFPAARGCTEGASSTVRRHFLSFPISAGS
jgi:hypothetical protein